MFDSMTLLRAMNGIHVEDVTAAGNIYFDHKEPRYFRSKRLIPVAIAAALILSLGIAAYSAGLLAPIFHSIRLQRPTPTSDNQDVSPEFAEVMDSYYEEVEEKNKLYEAAEQYMLDQQPEPVSVSLPEFDNSKITLSEQYYTGEILLLGVNLEEVVPEMTVGYSPNEDLLEKINNVAFFHDVKGNDDLDALLADGMMQEIYDDYLENRSDYAKEYDFRHLSAIEMDWMLKRELSPEEYEAAWKLLQENGHLCVVENSVYIGDHILMEDGTDLGQTGQIIVDTDEEDVHSGNIFIEASSLPEAAKNLDRLNIQLKVKNSRVYYYMELGGPALSYYEPVGEIAVPFTIENAGD